MEEALEAMGGTGDTLTGIVSALIDSGMSIREASVVAMKANRLAGHYAKPTPSTQIIEVIHHIPKALSKVLEKRERDISKKLLMPKNKIPRVRMPGVKSNHIAAEAD